MAKRKKRRSYSGLKLTSNTTLAVIAAVVVGGYALLRRKELTTFANELTDSRAWK